MKQNLLLLATLTILSSLIINYPNTRFSPPETIEGNWKNSNRIPIQGAVGPESFAFDPLGGGPYTGVSDGRIIKWLQNENQWMDFARTAPKRYDCRGPHDQHHISEHICGRPLGLAFNKMSGDLYIADAYLGLHVVGPEGGQATRLVTRAQGIPFKFINGLDIDQNNGDVYFSDSSSYFHRRNYMLLSVSGDRSGRLLKYNQKDKQVTVLVENLRYPNGVALSKDSNYILIAETPTCRILKFWLKTSRAGSLEVFAQLPGYPDNIKRNLKGEFWVGIYSRRGKIAKWVILNPWIGKFLLKLPVDPMRLQSMLTKWGGGGLAIKMNEEGNIVKILEDKSRKQWRSISEVEERNGTLWIGSVTEPYAGMCNTSL
ncbi:hypothetical protein RJ641_025543, partial [Dillenia turbinata]